jgi:hypothetical protein
MYPARIALLSAAFVIGIFTSTLASAAGIPAALRRFARCIVTTTSGLHACLPRCRTKTQTEKCSNSHFGARRSRRFNFRSGRQAGTFENGRNSGCRSDLKVALRVIMRIAGEMWRLVDIQWSQGDTSA